MVSTSFIGKGVALLLAAMPVIAAEGALPKHVTDAFEAYIALPNTLVPVLESAKDRKSADAAAPALKNELRKLYDTRTALQNVKTLDAGQKELVMKKYERPMRERWGRVYSQMFRLQNNKCFQSPEFAHLFQIMCLMLNK